MKRPLLCLALSLGALARGHAAEVPERIPPPIAMEDASGQGLRLARLDVRLAAHGPLALTELDLTFRNPRARTLEGRFSCVLPPRARVSRFARRVGESWLEGEVVERRRAAEVYDASIQTGVGASLIEQDRGNRFRARIFPVRPGEEVRLLLSYSSLQPVDSNGRRSLTVPLVGLTGIGHFSFRAHCRPLAGERVVLDGWLGSSRVETVEDAVVFSQEIVRADFTPRTNLVFSFSPPPEDRSIRRARAGELVMTSVRPRVVPPVEAREPEEWILLIDTSASGATARTSRLAILEELVRELERGGVGRTSLVLEAFDIAAAPLYRYRAGEDRAGELRGHLERRRFLGATDLAVALRRIRRLARGSERARNFVLVSDTVPTLGETDAGALAALLGELPESCRLHVLGIGSVRDAGVARALAKAGRGRAVTVPISFDTRGEARRAVAELRRVPGSTFSVTDPGALWVHPRGFRDVRPGEELVFFTHRRPGASSRPVVTGEDGTRLEISDDPVDLDGFGPLLTREAWGAYLDELAARPGSGPAERQRRREEMVEVSVARRVLCRETSMLLLNHEEEYERYGVDRRALAEVLEVGERGVRLRTRSEADLVEAPVVAPSRLPPGEPVRDSVDPLPMAGGPSAAGMAADDVKNLEAITIEFADELALLNLKVRSLEDGFVELRGEVDRMKMGGGSLALGPTSSAGYVPVGPTPMVRVRRFAPPLPEEAPSPELERRLRDLPEDPEVYEELGETYRRAGHFRNAARAYSSLVELAPRDAEVLLRTGYLLLGLGHARAARPLLRRALDERPRSLNAGRGLALALLQLGHTGRARKELEALLARDWPSRLGPVKQLLRMDLAWLYGGDAVAEGVQINLVWDSPATDLDLRVRGPSGEVCTSFRRSTRDGLRLLADISQGRGPEVITAPAGIPLGLGVRYARPGPMDRTRGLVLVRRRRGSGGAHLQVLPFTLKAPGKGPPPVLEFPVFRNPGG